MQGLLSIRIRHLIALLGAFLALASCGRPDLEDYADRTPRLDLVEYFTGKTYAWGQFQDRFGKVRSSFSVEIDGTWDGTTLTLDERFLYEDGRTEQRIWSIRREGPDTWSGTAPGVVGRAQGVVSGNALNWRYTFDLTDANGDVMRVGFDDWLWQIDAGTVFNRAYVSRYGIEIGEVLIFFTRTPPQS